MLFITQSNKSGKAAIHSRLDVWFMAFIITLICFYSISSHVIADEGLLF